LELTDDATVSVPAHQAGLSPLTIRVGDDSYTVEPTDGQIIIGREFPAQVQVNDHRISRNHLRIEPQGDRWTALDTSTNGTYYNGDRQGFLVITDGMTIHLGNAEGIPVTFAFTSPAARAQTASAPLPPVAAEEPDAEETPEGEETDPRIARAGAAVAARREELSISQRTLAREKIVNAGALIAFEKGRSWPHKSTQAKLERVLGWEPGTISRLRDDPGYNPVGAEPGEATEVLTTTVQAPLMAEAIELALENIRNSMEGLPAPEDADFTRRIGGVLNDLRKVQALAANAARSARGAPEVALVLSTARKMYRDVMLRATRSPQATLGQRLFAARHRAELTIDEAANAAGVPVDAITTAESDLPLNPQATAALQSLVTSLTRR
jgi:transcriptional regulator with XRE-family HTH domain